MIVGETRRLQGRTSVKTFEKMRMCATSIKSEEEEEGERIVFTIQLI